MTTGLDRRIEFTPLDEIAGALRNPKKHELDGIKRSIARFGFVAPSIMDSRTGRLVAGHGRTLALRGMRDQGDPVPAGIRLSTDGGWLVPVQHGWASQSDAEAEAYLVADNEWTMRGAWDSEQLADFLSGIVDSDPDLLAVTGYTPDDMDDLLAAIGTGLTHDAVPATNAAYAETEEEEHERAARQTAYAARDDNYAEQLGGAVTEMILIYTVTDREELQTLIGDCRSALGQDLKASEVLLRAARVLAAVTAAKLGPIDDGDWAQIVQRAGIFE
jgi:hypothetical protein